MAMVGTAGTGAEETSVATVYGADGFTGLGDNFCPGMNICHSAGWRDGFLDRHEQGTTIEATSTILYLGDRVKAVSYTSTCIPLIRGHKYGSIRQHGRDHWLG